MIFLDAMKDAPVDLNNLGVQDRGLVSIVDDLRRFYGDI